MSDNGLHRQQDLYWMKMVELKAAASYMGMYRDYLGRWVQGVSTVRAIASTASIAGWAIWRQYAFIWGLVIACSQVLDAVRDVFPIAKKFKSASGYCVALNRLFIDAQLEWEDIFAGRYSDEQISRRLHKLRTMHHNAESHSFPEGLSKRVDLFALAETEGKAFFRKTYGVD